MKDREFLAWIHARLVNIHHESPAFDYMHKLRGIVKATPPDKDSPLFSGPLTERGFTSAVQGKKLRRA